MPGPRVGGTRNLKTPGMKRTWDTLAMGGTLLGQKRSFLGFRTGLGRVTRGQAERTCLFYLKKVGRSLGRWGYGPVVKCLPSMNKTMGSIPIMQNNNNNNNDERQGWL
jgi:hypothetical protein